MAVSKTPERDLQLLAIGLGMANSLFRSKLNPLHFVDRDLATLVSDIKEAEPDEAWKRIWLFLESGYQVARADGKPSDAILQKLKVDYQTERRLHQISALSNELLSVYEGTRDKRAFLKEAESLLGELSE